MQLSRLLTILPAKNVVLALLMLWIILCEAVVHRARVEFNFKSEGFYIFECRQIELRDFPLVECVGMTPRIF